MAKPLLNQLLGKKGSRVPFWFMRQAGRYLPEYRALRASSDGFLDLCFTPKNASEVTLQPIKRFGMDGAILFSDILVTPLAMGMGVRFAAGEGPILDAVKDNAGVGALADADKENILAPIYETIALTKAALPKETTFLGFAGSPWTVACYMLQGKGGNEFVGARAIAYQNPALVKTLIEKISSVTADYLCKQIEAGVDAIQLFDSWAGFVNPLFFDDFVINPTQFIIDVVKEKHPNTPIICFPKGAAGQLARYSKLKGVSALGIDQFTDLHFAQAQANNLPLQGNLDPILLANDKHASLAQAREIRGFLQPQGGIFNLGHGMIPSTPIDHVEALCEMLRDG